MIKFNIMVIPRINANPSRSKNQINGKRKIEEKNGIILRMNKVLVLPWTRRMFVLIGDNPYMIPKSESSAKIGNPCSYCCPPNNTITGLAVMNNPRLNGNIDNIVYLLARVIPRDIFVGSTP